jgi:hypothetical protein
MRLTANASDQAADDADCEQEKRNQHADSEWTLEELDECAA